MLNAMAKNSKTHKQTSQAHVQTENKRGYILSDWRMKFDLASRTINPES